MTICPPELKKRYNDCRVIPFIGAGASMSVEWDDGGEKRKGPSWKELVDRAILELGFKDPELARVRGSDLQLLEYFKLKNHNQIAKLTNWMSKYLDPPDSVLVNSPIHSELAKLINCKVYYTTNFDNFLERGLNLGGRSCNVVAVENEMGISHGDCEVVKFHGDLDHPDQIVLTELHYERRLSLSNALDYRLRSDLLGRYILFLGYSFRDANVSYLFRLFTDHFATTDYRGYILFPDPSDLEYELFKARRIQVIPIDGSRQTESIANFLSELRA